MQNKRRIHEIHAIFTAIFLASPLILVSAPDTVDAVFANSAGQVFDPAATGGVSSVLVQPDGKILFGSNEMPGDFGGTTRSTALTRFNSNGSVDSYFFADNEPNGSDAGIYYDGAGWPETHALGLQSDGKIIAAGVMQGVRIGTQAAPTLEFRSNSLVRFNADGSIDTTFQTNGTKPSTNLNFIEDVTIAPDDKIYAVGGFGGFRDSESDPYTTRYGIARLNADGSLDTTFEVDPAEFGVPAGVPNLSGFFREAAVAPSGKIYIAGSFQYGYGFPQTTIPVVARVFSNGRLDTSFNAAVPANTYAISGLELEPDGRLAVLGYTDLYQTESFVVRLLPDGTLDPSFNLDPSLTRVSARPLQRDAAGKYLLTTPNTAGDAPRGVLIRITSTGAIDPTFRAEKTDASTGFFNTFTTGANGKIYAGSGASTAINGVDTIKLVGFEGDLLPASFAWTATLITPAESAGSVILSVTRSGDLTAPASVSYATTTGSATAADFTATSGTLTWPAGVGGAKTFTLPLLDDAIAEPDETFTVNLSAASGASISGASAITVTIRDDDSPPVIVTQPAALTVKQGEAASFSVAVSSPIPPTYQWQKNGADIPGATASVYSIPATSLSDDADYSVVISGTVSSAVAHLTVLPPAATVDPAFSYSGVTEPGNFTFLATGFFSEINGVARRRLARLDANGEVDLSFVPFFNSGSFPVNAYTGYFNGLAGVQLADSGAIYAMVRSSNQGNRLFRMLPDGSADSTFSTAFNYSSNANLSALTELPDGSILIGYTAGFSSLTRGIRRVLADGTFDPNFAHFSTTSNPTSILVLDEDRFLAIHGNLLTIHDLTDGSLLETHTFTGTLTSIEPYRGRFLITGPTEFDGTALPGVALFSLDGSVDDNFPGGAGPNANVLQASVDTQGRIVVVGDFTTWNGAAAPNMTRLLVERAELAFDTDVLNIAEDGGSVSLSVVRYGDISAAASVRVISTPDSALEPDDYAGIDQILSWPAGDATPKSVTLTPVNDALLEPAETFSLALSEATGGTAVSFDATVTILDDDSRPKITSQPEAAFAVLGKPVSLSVTATSPTALNYQWFLGSDPIPGATSATYSIAAAAEADVGDYRVRLTNDEASIFSDTVSLVLIADPAALAPNFITPTALTSSVYAIAPTPDGGAYVGGAFSNVGGDPNRDFLVRLDANGVLDTSFTPPVLNNQVLDLALQPDGKLIAVGQFSSVAGSTIRRIVRLETTGALDPTFTANVGTGPNGTLYAVALEPDGSILVGGSFSSLGATDLGNGDDLVRLDPNGLLVDKVYFDFSTQIQDLLVLPDGDILAAYNTTSSSAAKVRRFNSDLTLDNSLNYSSGRTRVQAMALSAAGNFLFAGSNGLFEVDSSGAILKTFPNTGYLALARQLNGKVIGGGSSGARLFRYLADGSVDPTFSPSANPSGSIQALALGADGKIWVGGFYTTINGTTVNNLAILNGDPIPIAFTEEPSGTAIVEPASDVSFSAAAVGTSAIAYQWKKGADLLSDGSGISGSNTAMLTLTAVDAADAGDYSVVITNESGTRTSTTATLVVLGAPEIISLSGDVSALAGGSLELSVDVYGASTLSYLWKKDGVALSDTGSILGADTANLTIAPTVTGDSGTYTVFISNSLGDITSLGIVVDILPNGAAPATGFIAPTSNGSIRRILPLGDGRALVSGYFSTITDGSVTSNGNLAAINEDGSVVDLPNLSASGQIESMRFQSDGKILLAGSFSQINGVDRAKLARLNADLSLDLSFNPQGFVGSFRTPFDMVEEASGSLMVVGNFPDYDGNPDTAYAVRLTSSGDYDSSFTSGADSNIYTVLPQSDGSLVFQGQFSEWAGDADGDYIARVNSTGALVPGNSYNANFYFTGYGISLSSGDFLAPYLYGGGLRKYALDGTLDTNFLDGLQPNSTSLALAQHADGKIVLAGWFSSLGTTPIAGIARVSADGTALDTTFDPGDGFNSTINAVAVTASGKIWVGGDFTTYNGQPTSYLTLLQGDAETSSGDPLESFLSDAGVPEGQRGPDDDPDLDGIANIVEWIYELEPNVADTDFELFSELVASGGSSLNTLTGTSDFNSAEDYFTFSLLMPDDILGATLTVQAASDLTDFDTSPLSVVQVGAPVPAGAGFSRISYAFTSPVSTTVKGFVRLKIEL